MLSIIGGIKLFDQVYALTGGGPGHATDTISTLTVTVPPNTTAELRVPLQGGRVVRPPHRGEFLRTDGDHAVWRIPSGTFTVITASR
jgi:hypothetical protein